MSIRSKLLLIFALFAFGGPCLVMMVAGWQARRDGLSDYIEASQAQMERANDFIKIFFEAVSDNSRYIADIPEFREAYGKMPIYVNSKERIQPSPETMTSEARLADSRLEQITRAYTEYEGIGVGMQDGGFLNSPRAPRSAGYDPRARGWYKTAMQASSRTSVSELYRASQGTPVCTVMSRITDSNGKPAGVSYIDIKLDTITRMVESIRLGESGRLVLIENTGMIISAPRFKDSAFTNISEGKIKGLEDVLGLAPGTYTRDVGGVSSVFTLIKGFGDWRYLFVMNESEINESSNSMLLQLIGITLLLSLIPLFLGLAFARNISRPILGLVDSVGRVAAGDFDVDLSSNRKDELGTLSAEFRDMVKQMKERLGFARGIMNGIVIPFAVADANGHMTFLNQQMIDFWGLRGKPEDFYGKTAGDFFDGRPGSSTPLDQVLKTRQLMLNVPIARTNSRGAKIYMRLTASPLWDLDDNLIGACLLITNETEIREQQNRILALNERITLSVKNAHEISARQAEAFSRLTQQLDRTSEYASAQETASSQTVDSISDMSNTLERLADKAKQTTEDTRATRREAELGSSIVADTVQSINKVASLAESTEQGVNALGKQAEGISDIVELIKDIADQTNLLALNAAIEAARAGESGRGFAVVADEVRKLAEKTMYATEDVNKSVSALQAEVNSTINLTSQTLQLAKESTELAEKSGTSLRSIVSIAEHAVGEVLSISEATAEQARMGVSIAESTTAISSMAQETVLNMSDSSRFVEELAGLSEELKKLIDSMGADRRRSERFSLDYPYMISLELNNRRSVSCRVMDISTTGIRLESKEGPADWAEIKTRVVIHAPDEPLNDLLDGIGGHVSWCDGAFCGIEFESKLKVEPDKLDRTVNKTSAGW